MTAKEAIKKHLEEQGWKCENDAWFYNPGFFNLGLVPAEDQMVVCLATTIVGSIPYSDPDMFIILDKLKDQEYAIQYYKNFNFDNIRG